MRLFRSQEAFSQKFPNCFQVSKKKINLPSISFQVFWLALSVRVSGFQVIYQFNIQEFYKIFPSSGFRLKNWKPMWLVNYDEIYPLIYYICIINKNPLTAFAAKTSTSSHFPPDLYGAAQRNRGTTELGRNRHSVLDHVGAKRRTSTCHTRRALKTSECEEKNVSWWLNQTGRNIQQNSSTWTSRRFFCGDPKSHQSSGSV